MEDQITIPKKLFLALINEYNALRQNDESAMYHWQLQIEKFLKEDTDGLDY